jgi:hypothetical protein
MSPPQIIAMVAARDLGEGDPPERGEGRRERGERGGEREEDSLRSELFSDRRRREIASVVPDRRLLSRERVEDSGVSFPTSGVVDCSPGAERGKDAERTPYTRGLPNGRVG